MRGTVLSTRTPSHRALSYRALRTPIRGGHAVATCVWFPEFSRISGTYWLGRWGLGGGSWGFLPKLNIWMLSYLGVRPAWPSNIGWSRLEEHDAPLMSVWVQLMLMIKPAYARIDQQDWTSEPSLSVTGGPLHSSAAPAFASVRSFW